jgi:hypothetical protein
MSCSCVHCVRVVVMLPHRIMVVVLDHCRPACSVAQKGILSSGCELILIEEGDDAE